MTISLDWIAESMELNNEKYMLKTIPLWDARWDRESLVKKRRSIGERRFNQQYRNIPTDYEDLTFPNFDSVLFHGVETSVALPDKLEYYAGVDISTSKRPGTVIFTYGYDRENDIRYVWKGSIEIGKWKGPQLRDHLVASYKVFKHRLINVETNAIQQGVYEFLKEEKTRLPLRSFKTQYKNKTDMTIGLEAMDVMFEQGKWRFLGGRKEHSPSCTCSMCRCVTEFRNHPNVATQDVIMACWFANRALKTFRGTPRIRSF